MTNSRSGKKNRLYKEFIKHRLYKEFIKHQTKDKEDKYKNYKNRLTSIMRTQKKDYYNQLLFKYKNNNKATRDVLNDMINKHGKKGFSSIFS